MSSARRWTVTLAAPTAVAIVLSCASENARLGDSPEPSASDGDAPSLPDDASSDSAFGDSAFGDADAGTSVDACVDGGCDPVVFVTSTDYTGALGGVIGADQECATLAAAAGLSGTFAAWISAADAGPPATRFTGKSSAPYRLRDGRRVAASFAALTTLLEAPISVTEKGDDIGFAYVWTATDPNGLPTSGATDCGGWSSSDPVDTGGTGESDDQNNEWTIFMNRACDTRARLYCFEQRP